MENQSYIPTPIKDVPVGILFYLLVSTNLHKKITPTKLIIGVGAKKEGFEPTTTVFYD